MDPIREGATGAAVEDIQERLASLGYEIDAAERDAKSFGSSTTSAVARFRIVETSCISTMNVDSPAVRSSDAPTRVKIWSTTEIFA